MRCSRSLGAWLLLAACGDSPVPAAATDEPVTIGPSGQDSDDTASTGAQTGTTTTTEGSSSSGDESGSELPCEAPMTRCGTQCVDTRTDPSNCSGCGISCVIPQGEAACDQEICAVAACDDGWSDCDGDPLNGCEVESTCTAGSECTTECGSIGVTACDASCSPVCTVLAESCNAIDDDCDTECDEGLDDCRVPVHRANGGSLGHFYTTDLTEAQSGGFSLEAENYFSLYLAEGGGLQPLFRCLKPNGNRLYTTATDCEELGSVELTVGFISPSETCGAIPLYRVFSSAAGNHFYTISAPERDNAVTNLGYVDEGIAGYVWAG